MVSGLMIKFLQAMQLISSYIKPTKKTTIKTATTNKILPIINEPINFNVPSLYVNFTLHIPKTTTTTSSEKCNKNISYTWIIALKCNFTMFACNKCKIYTEIKMHLLLAKYNFHFTEIISIFFYIASITHFPF